MQPKPIQVIVSNGQVISLAETEVRGDHLIVLLSVDRQTNSFVVFSKNILTGEERRIEKKNIRDAGAKAVDMLTATRIVKLFEMCDVTESKIIELFGDRAHLVDVTVIEEGAS